MENTISTLHTDKMVLAICPTMWRQQCGLKLHLSFCMEIIRLPAFKKLQQLTELDKLK